MKTLLMTGTALVMLAAPALAGTSTRSEIETTRQLNRQAAQSAAPNPAPARDTSAGANAPPSAAPTMAVQTAEMDTRATLATMTNPPSKIATANVLDSSGKIVGAVQRVEVSPQGQPTKVSVALLGKDERMVVLDAGAVRYDVARNEIMSEATGDQMKAMSDKS